MAQHLREIAQQVEATNQEVQSLYVELAATAGVSILTGLVSFGAGAAAGAARAALLVRRATRIKRLLSAFLAARRAVFALTRTSRIARFTSRFLAGAAETAAAQAATKQLVYGEHPFDPGNWSATDLAGIATGGLLNPWAFAKGNLTALRRLSGIRSVDDVLKNPRLLAGRSPREIEALLGSTPGWRIESLGKGSHRGMGWVLREYTPEGRVTGRMLRWHPGGGHHGPDPYWRVTSPEGGKSLIIPGGPDS